MPTNAKPLAALTASDLMKREVVTARHDMLIHDAAQLLLRNQISGLPVVDDAGRCVGILSATDFVKIAGRNPDAIPLPLACNFQEKKRDPSGKEVSYCKLPYGACPLQQPPVTHNGVSRSVCNDSQGVPSDWQMVEVETRHPDQVCCHMTTDIVTALPETRISDLARRMLDGRIHRLVVVDEDFRPVGMVSSTDLLAALAYAEEMGSGDFRPASVAPCAT